MIIDCHRHVWAGPKQLTDGSLGGSAPLPERPGDMPPNLAEVRDAPMRGLVDCSIILGFKSTLLGVDIGNDFVAEFVAKHRDCAVGFAGIDPTERGAPAEADRLIREQGFSGVVLSPGAQGYHPCDTRAMGLYEKLAELDVPVMMHYPERWLSAGHLDKAVPGLLDEVARTFGTLKMIISGMGWPYVEETLAMLAKHQNIYADLSIVANRPLGVYQVISSAYNYQIMDKLMFGSGWPYCTVRAAMGALYNINDIPRQTGLPSVPREALRTIVERNSLKLLGIKQPGSTAKHSASQEQAPQKAAVSEGY